VRLDPTARSRLQAERERLAAAGLRVVAVARREVGEVDAEADVLQLLNGLTLLALVGLGDAPKPSAKVAIERANAAGVRVRMLTGDRVRTAEAVSRALGIEEGLLGRATPALKLRMTRSLQREGHVVVALGDSVSDAPALAAADVGVAKADGGAVAREAAAVVLAADPLPALVRAIERGRDVCARLDGYLCFQARAQVALILTFLVSGVLGLADGVAFEPLPLIGMALAVQIPVGLGGARPVRAVVQAVVTLSVLALAEHEWGTDTAQTMALVTFSLVLVAAALQWRAAAIALAAVIVLGGGAELALGQWLICAAAGLVGAAAGTFARGSRPRRGSPTVGRARTR
jgi:Ca2+-transporting ATPase